MRKVLLLLLAVVLSASQAFATYIVILKDGTRYRARERWTVANGKALISLENGSVMTLDPSLIDIQKTSEINRLGLGDVNIIARESPQSPSAPAEQSTLGGSVPKLRQAPKTPPGTPTNLKKPAAPPVTEPKTPDTSVPATGALGNDVLTKFQAAYDNVGLYDAAVTSKEPAKVHVELTADNEDKVFKAISATSYMLLRVPEATGVKIDMVELFMRTINGGAAGRFQMTPVDARQLDSREISLPDYFIRKVLF